MSSSSAILYKFRSGTTFEALPLPGSAARLIDVKKAIVKAKKLDATSQALEFDLSVKDATTNQEYVDESMLLPRGTRLIVQRLPAARGHGFLSRMARAESGAHAAAGGSASAVPSSFYTIQSREEDDEFVPAGQPEQQQQDDKELNALMAVMDPGAAAASGPSGGLRPSVGYNRPAGSGPPPPRGPVPGHYGPPKHARPNADPELRAQEPAPKKRATGIPRTFLNISAPPQIEGAPGAEGGAAEPVARLQPNPIGFEELKARGGGQSENLTGTKRDLDYALKVTGTPIPEHLQCGICHNVVKNAMLLPSDQEGRTACETCIRDALTQSGFVCPLTGIEGVSPDDLLPNYGLRKAAEAFVNGVMEKMQEIDQQEEDEEGAAETTGDGGVLEGDSADKGVLVSRKTIGRSKRDEADPFGGGDADFGGDVFDVQAEEAEEEAEEPSNDAETDKHEEKPSEPATEPVAQSPEKPVEKLDLAETKKESPTAVEQSNNANKPSQSDTHGSEEESQKETKTDHDRASPQNASSSRRDARRRGPPAGYATGPAGASAVRGAQPSPYAGRGPRAEGTSPSGRGFPPDRATFRGGRGSGRGGRFFDGRGRGPEFEGRGRGFPGRFDEDADSRGSKRRRSGSEDYKDDRSFREGRGRFDPHGPPPPPRGAFDPRGPPPPRGGFDPRGPPPPRGGRADFYRGGRGGRGRFGGRGGRY